MNAAILEVIRGGAYGRTNAYANHRALQAKAGWFTGFAHFRSLCIGDLRQAYDDDRRDKTRTTKNRRLTWLAMFRCFAIHAGIDKDLEIIALDRQGNYACNLTDKSPADDWEKFVRLGERFGIAEEELDALLQAKSRHSRAAKPSSGAKTPQPGAPGKANRPPADRWPERVSA